MKGFKDFLMRGNVVDLAVAVIIGAAFGEVVKSFVAILMNIIGRVWSTPDFTSFKPADIPIGAFLTSLVSFLIIGAVIYFLIVLPMNKIAQRRKKGQEESSAPSEETVLLTEIRDLLARR